MKQRPVSRSETDEVHAPFVIRSEYEPMLTESFECGGHITGFQVGAIASNDDDFIVTTRRQCPDRGRQALCKVATTLNMNLDVSIVGRTQAAQAGKEVAVNVASQQIGAGDSKNRSQIAGPPAASQVEGRNLGENEQGPSRC